MFLSVSSTDPPSCYTPQPSSSRAALLRISVSVQSFHHPEVVHCVYALLLLTFSSHSPIPILILSLRSTRWPAVSSPIEELPNSERRRLLYMDSVSAVPSST